MSRKKRPGSGDKPRKDPVPAMETHSGSELSPEEKRTSESGAVPPVPEKDPLPALPPLPTESAPFPWELVFSVVLVLVLFALRRFLRAMFPILLIAVVFVPLFIFCWRKYKYRDLDEVYTEYDELLTLLDQKGLYTYSGGVRRSMEHLMAARDRVEQLQELLRQSSPESQRQRLSDLQEQLAAAREPEQVALLTKSARDVEETLHHLEHLQVFLNRYADGKKNLAGSFRNVRLRLQVKDAAALVPSPEGLVEDDVDIMVRQMVAMDLTYDAVDRLDAPPPPERNRQAQ